MSGHRTLELILLPHAIERLNDETRFDTGPDMPADENASLLRFRRADDGSEAWICYYQRRYLVGEIKSTRKREMLLVRTVVNREMFRNWQERPKPKFIPVARIRVRIDKITIQRPAKTRPRSGRID